MSSKHWKELRQEISLCFPEPFRPFKDGNYGYVLLDGGVINIESVRALQEREQVETEGEWRTREFQLRLTEAGIRAAVSDQDSGIIEYLLSVRDAQCCS